MAPISAELRALRSLHHDGISTEKDHEAFRRFLEDPVKNDPLWIGNQERLKTYALWKGKSVIACLPDQMYRSAVRRLSLDPATYGCEAKTTSSTIEIQPESYVDHWRSQASRPLMKECVKGFRENGVFDILSYIRLAASVDDYRENGLGIWFVGLADEKPNRPVDLPLHPGFSHVVAALTPEQIKQLSSGREIPYTQLTSRQLKFVENVLFGSRTNFSWVNMTEDEPTMAAPSGLASSGKIFASIGEARIAVMFFRETSAVALDLGAMDEKVRINHGVIRLTREEMAKTKVSMHRRQKITMRLYLGKGYTWDEFEGALSEADGKAIPFPNLPEDVRKSLEKAFLEHKN